MISIIQQTFLSHTNVIRMHNPLIELQISLDFGPRILFFGKPQGENLFYIRPQDFLEVNPRQFTMYGGHRLWLAPEDIRRTYIPDNEPVQWQQSDGQITVTQNASAQQPCTKTMMITMDSDRPLVRLCHALTNHSQQPLEVAPWAITQMAPGGVGIMPLPPRGAHPQHLLPNGSLVLWPYSNLADPRWRWGYSFIRIQQDAHRQAPLKFGMSGAVDWLAYANRNQLFIKQSVFHPDKTYPDRGTPIQIFVNHEMLELETLAPLTAIQPGETVHHQETWQLIDAVPPIDTDLAVQELVCPYLGASLADSHLADCG